MSRQYCAGCGERVRLRWPAEEPTFCRQRCAAEAMVLLIEADPYQGYCPDCGEPGVNCQGRCQPANAYAARAEGGGE